MAEQSDEPLGRRIDWHAARDAIANAESRLRLALAGDERFCDALLRERTIELAEPPRTAEEPGEPVLVLRGAAGRFALPLAEVRRIEPVERPTPVPHAPAWVIGLAPLAGEPHLLLDLDALMDAPGAEPPPVHAVLLRHPVARVALCGHYAEAIARFRPRSPPPPFRHVAAIAADDTMLVDVGSVVERALQWDRQG